MAVCNLSDATPFALTQVVAATLRTVFSNVVLMAEPPHPAPVPQFATQRLPEPSVPSSIGALIAVVSVANEMLELENGGA